MTENQEKMLLAYVEKDVCEAYNSMVVNNREVVGIAVDKSNGHPVKIGELRFTLKEAAIIAESIIEAINAAGDHHHMEEEAEAVVIWLHDFANFGVIPW